MGRVTVTIDTDVGVRNVGLEIRVGVVFVVVVDGQNVARNRKRHFRFLSVKTLLHSLSVLGMPVNK